MIKETVLPASDKAQVLFDAVHEPYEACKWDKRRKCDSFYIEMYNKQKKKIEKVLEIIDTEIDKDYIIDTLLEVEKILKSNDAIK